MVKIKHHFLKIYTWIILLFITVGILIYTAIQNPQIMQPEKCDLQLGLYCKKQVINLNEKEISLTIQNSMQDSIVIHSISVDGNSFVNCIANSSYKPFSEQLENKLGWKLNSEEQKEIAVHCEDIIEGKNRMLGEITLKWSNEDANDVFLHTIKGTLLGVPKTGDKFCCCNSNTKPNFWVDESSCVQNIQGRCLGNNFHTCQIQQESCCKMVNPKEGSYYIWGTKDCFGNTTLVVKDSFCKY